MQSKYAAVLGGLEPANEESTVIIDDVTYVFSEKFKAMLRDSCLDWASFINIYQDNLHYDGLFDEVTKVLNIKANEHLRGLLIPLVKTIYNLPKAAHLACMMRQFMVFDIVTIALHSVFDIIKLHFEQIVKLFVVTRAEKWPDLLANNWEELLAQWTELDDVNDYNSSSVILLFLNPPAPEVAHTLHIDFPGPPEAVKGLRTALAAFQYKGFCRLVPHKRLWWLLQFPLREFTTAIRVMDPSVSLPDYATAEGKVKAILDDAPVKMKVSNDEPRKVPPASMLNAAAQSTVESITTESSKAKMQLIMWYVNAIFDLRKAIYTDGRQLECYYESTAIMLSQIATLLRQELVL